MGWSLAFQDVGKLADFSGNMSVPPKASQVERWVVVALPTRTAKESIIEIGLTFHNMKNRGRNGASTAGSYVSNIQNNIYCVLVLVCFPVNVR